MKEETLQRKMIVYRAKYNLTQKELAKLCSVSQQTINAVELGVRKPGRFVEQKILNVIEKGEK